MTRLRPDYPAFETEPPWVGWLSPEQVAFQLAGPLAGLYAEEIRAAVAAVVYFFRHDLGRRAVPVAEFAATLNQALGSLGLSLALPPRQAELGLETDLAGLLDRAGPGGRLTLCARLRAHLRQQLQGGPAIIRYCGLRRCVRRVLGARRWTPRCQRLADQIVSFLRACLAAESQGNPCLLVVR